MPYNPWTLIGWLMAALLLLMIVAAPFVGFGIYRAHRRTLAAIARSRAQHDRWVGVSPWAGRYGRGVATAAAQAANAASASAVSASNASCSATDAAISARDACTGASIATHG